MKYRSHGNFFSLPNEIFLWGLSSGAFAVYSFLRRVRGSQDPPMLAQHQNNWTSGADE